MMYNYKGEDWDEMLYNVWICYVMIYLKGGEQCAARQS